MTRKITSVAILSLLLVAFLGAAVFAASSPQQVKRTVDKQINASMQYAFPYPGEPIATSSERVQPSQQLGSAAPSASPGLKVGNTFYDYQHNGRMGRMNETRTGSVTLAHFSWMFLGAGDLAAARAAAYTQYDFSTQTLYTPYAILTSTGDYAGYVNLDVTNDNRGVVVCHNKQAIDGVYDATVYWDFAEGFVSFGYVDSVPALLSQYMMQPEGAPYQQVIWPTMSFVEGPGTGDTVTHVFGQASLPAAGDPQAIYYFRRVGAAENPSAAWDYPPYVVDTVHDIAQSVEGSDNGKTALVWIANVPCTSTDPDTASCDDIGGATQWNNDLYYQISNDYGVTWQPRVNLTKSRIAQDADLPHFQPYTALNILLDTEEDLHIVWNAAYWPTGSTLYVFSRSAILHWSEDVPYIRTVHDATWEPGDCFPGVWNLTAAKASISQCAGKFYVAFTQFNDRPNGVLNDCATESNPGYPQGAANGDLYVTISADNGLTWDVARNLTNSRTPGCDSVGGAGGPCDNDHWMTMARFGDNHNAGPAVPIVVPAGGTGGAGNYVDIQYINDKSAGGIVQGEGTWQNSDVKWFRLQCVNPIVAPNPTWSPPEIGFPSWTKAGVTYTKTITITNIGNADYNYGVTANEDPGPLSGWLGHANFAGLVQSGLNNVATGNLVITPTGASPGQIYRVTGRLTFTTTDLPVPRVDNFQIDFIVADTLIPPVWDTINTGAVALQVRSDGLFGAHDDTHGGVGMDFYPGDCDTTAWPYLYSGSPIIMAISGTDTLANWTIFENDYTTPVGFYPLGHTAVSVDSGAQIFRSTFVTRDSAIAFEKTWYAPQTNVDFVIQCLKVYSNDGLAHNDLLIGEVVDWDVPSDSASRNGSNYNASLGLFWQFGGEYGQDDATECQESDARFAAMKFIGGQYPDGSGFADPHGAYTKDNPTYVYGNTYGFVKAQLWENMTAGGWTKYTSTAPESLYTDLHMGMAFVNGLDLPANGDPLYIWSAYITIENGTQTTMTAAAEAAQAWAAANLPLPDFGCCVMRGDFNDNGAIQVSDLTALIGFLFRGGPGPACFEHADINANGSIQVSDLTALIGFLFRGGPPPAGC